MGMSRSTYYFEIGKTDVVEERNAKLTKEIEEIFFKIMAITVSVGYTRNF